MRFIRTLVAVACFAIVSVAMADRPIFLVTPQGVWQSFVVDGKPGPWKPIAADVIVQGFVTGGPPDTNPPLPEPPKEEDSSVEQIKAISKSVLKSREEATAAGAIINSISKLNLNPADFEEAIKLAASTIDTQFKYGGRVTEWARRVFLVTKNPEQIAVGISLAWDVSPVTLERIHTAARNPESDVTGEALDWTKLIAIIQMILEVLKLLKIGGGS